MTSLQIIFLAVILSKVDATAGLEQIEPQIWRGWDKYQVIMWSTGEPKNLPSWFKQLKKMNCTAEECTRGADSKPFIENDFGFYVENLVSELAFLHSRQKLYDDDFQGYTTTQDKRYLIRNPCLNDPAFWKDIKPELQDLVKPYVPHQPLLYDLRDELSIGSFASPMDYCFGPYTLNSFRQWLQEQYGSLEELNKEWEANFATWDEVMPMTTYEIKDRELKALETGQLENYAPWADHRAFMDLTFAQSLGRLRGYIRELDPNTPVGIEGTQMPSTWGGYDLWRLSQVIDWIEPYDICNSREIFRSFLPKNAPVLGTVFGDDMNRIRRRLWWLLLHGDRGCIIWDDEKSRCIEKTTDDMALTKRGEGLSPIFSELKTIAPIIFNLKPLDDRIAIHYSQASIRANWMFDSREDGNTWHRRFSSYESVHSRFARVRDSFVRIIEDIGLQYNFVSYDQIENGELINGKYKVLILPQSVAMSQRECQQIEDFVKAGGTVIADNMTATMDEHCKRLPYGQLDELFGIKRNGVSWKAKADAGIIPSTVSESIPIQIYEPDIVVTKGDATYIIDNVPAIIVNHVGKGNTVYLNIDMHDYGKYRLSPRKGDNYLNCFSKLFKETGIEPSVKVLHNGESALCVEVLRYHSDDANYVALMRNPEFDADSLSAIGYTDNSELEKTIPIQVIFAKQAKIINIHTGKEFGITDQVNVELDPWSPTILKIQNH